MIKTNFKKFMYYLSFFALTTFITTHSNIALAAKPKGTNSSIIHRTMLKNMNNRIANNLHTQDRTAPNNVFYQYTQPSKSNRKWTPYIKDLLVKSMFECAKGKYMNEFEVLYEKIKTSQPDSQLRFPEGNVFWEDVCTKFKDSLVEQKEEFADVPYIDLSSYFSSMIKDLKKSKKNIGNGPAIFTRIVCCDNITGVSYDENSNSLTINQNGESRTWKNFILDVLLRESDLKQLERVLSGI